MVAPARCFIIRAIRIPSHPYSIGLLNAVARLDTKGEALMTIPGNPAEPAASDARLPVPATLSARDGTERKRSTVGTFFAQGRLRACFKPLEALM